MGAGPGGCSDATTGVSSPCHRAGLPAAVCLAWRVLGGFHSLRWDPPGAVGHRPCCRWLRHPWCSDVAAVPRVPSGSCCGADHPPAAPTPNPWCAPVPGAVSWSLEPRWSRGGALEPPRRRRCCSHLSLRRVVYGAGDAGRSRRPWGTCVPAGTPQGPRAGRGQGGATAAPSRCCGLCGPPVRGPRCRCGAGAAEGARRSGIGTLSLRHRGLWGPPWVSPTWLQAWGCRAARPRTVGAVGRCRAAGPRTVGAVGGGAGGSPRFGGPGAPLAVTGSRCWGCNVGVREGLGHISGDGR